MHELMRLRSAFFSRTCDINIVFQNSQLFSRSVPISTVSPGKLIGGGTAREGFQEFEGVIYYYFNVCLVAV